MNATTKARYTKALGKLTTAFWVLEAAVRSLPEGSPQRTEALILRGSVAVAVEKVNKALGKKLR